MSISNVDEVSMTTAYPSAKHDREQLIKRGIKTPPLRDFASYAEWAIVLRGMLDDIVEHEIEEAEANDLWWERKLDRSHVCDKGRHRFVRAVLRSVGR